MGAVAEAAIITVYVLDAMKSRKDFLQYHTCYD